MSSSPNVPPSRRGLPAGLGTPAAVLAFWTALGLLESAKGFVSNRLQGTPRSWGFVLVANMPWWLLWAALTPAVFWLASRLRLDGRTWPRRLAVHVAAALAVSALHLSVTGALFFVTTSHWVLPSASIQIERFLNAFLVVDMATYGAVVAGWHALDFNRRLREREVAAAQLEAGMAEARLSALRRELDPHFLFNTLNAVSTLVRRRDNDGAVRALARLGELLRITLDRDVAHRVPLERELLFLSHYLEIERLRFGDRLTVELDIEEGVTRALVPTLMLQPLVENAVRFGVAEHAGPGRVRVRAARRNGSLRIEVSDSGTGFAEASFSGADHGVGLANTRARLRQLCGPDARLELGNPPGGGATVTVELPYQV